MVESAPEVVIALEELAAAPRPRSEVGGKALHLASLLAAGLPVPEGFVVTAPVARMPQADKERALARVVERAGALAKRLAVRSSAAMEDGVLAGAPGVFTTVLDVSPDAVSEAVCRVWKSVEAALVGAYFAARGLGDGPVAMAVIVQRQIVSNLAGVLYTRLPGRPTSSDALIEVRSDCDSESSQRAIYVDRATRKAQSARQGLTEETLAELVELGLRAEAAIDAPAGADIEWAVSRDGSHRQIWLVQARPVVHPAKPPPMPKALLAFSRADPGLEWHWDVTHNPDPLSPAQAGLVERVDRAGLAPFRMRVVGGYLYTATIADSGHRPDLHCLDAADLRRQFDGQLLPAMNRALAAGLVEDAPLETVLEAYDGFYRVYAGDLMPLVSAARRALPAFLQTHTGRDGDRLASQLLADQSHARLETLVARVAAGEDTWANLLEIAGPMSPAWDVAVATFAEMPQLLRDSVAHSRSAGGQLEGDARGDKNHGAEQAASALRQELGPELAGQLDHWLAIARVARDIGELDDRLYARAQSAVRQALLRLARKWQLTPAGDIFFLPLDQVTAWSQQGIVPDPVALRRMAQAARAVRQRQQAWRMPLAFAGGEPIATTRPGRAGNSWRGLGTGGQVRGTALRVPDLGDLGAGTGGVRDAIMVAATITPSMIFWLEMAAGLVAQYGGLLDHGAAMARELGLPCVVNCAGAWDAIETGDTIWLDGDAGLVVRVEPVR